LLAVLRILFTYLSVTVCNQCGLSEPIVVFKRVDSRDHKCESCYKNYQRNYYFHKKKLDRSLNPEKIKKSSKKYYESHKKERRQYQLKNIGKYKIAWSKSHGKSRLQMREMMHRLKSVPCLDCGGIFDCCAMDFDHRDRSMKLASISEMISHASIDDILREIEKCDIICVNCHRERTHSKENNDYLGIKLKKKQYIDSLKNSPCSDCGSIFKPYQMDFDHIGHKTWGVSQMLGFSMNRILSEISRCELVCANCHRLRTLSRIRKTKPSEAA
jgi:hypothetical protein